jgi:hypothetical protein
MWPATAGRACRFIIEVDDVLLATEAIPKAVNCNTYCGGVQWHPLNYHLTRGLSIALKL